MNLNFSKICKSMKFSVQVNKSFNNICKHCGKPAAFLSLEDEIKNNKSYFQKIDKSYVILSLEDEIKNNKSYFQKIDKSYVMPLGDHSEYRYNLRHLGTSVNPMLNQSAILFNSHVKTNKEKINLNAHGHSSLRKYYWVAVCPCYKTEWKVSHSSDQTASYFKCNSLNDIYAKSKKLRKFTY